MIPSIKVMQANRKPEYLVKVTVHQVEKSIVSVKEVSLGIESFKVWIRHCLASAELIIQFLIPAQE